MNAESNETPASSKSDEGNSEGFERDVKDSNVSTPAERALKEAEARRAKRDAEMAQRPKEVDGRGGLDPVRYGDWEINGISSDF